MKLIDYLKSKIVFILIGIFTILLISFLLLTLSNNTLLNFSIPVFLLISYIIIFLYDYIRKSSFYKETTKVLNSLDKKYLVTEIIECPSFIEGEILVDYLYEINKSMIEEINKYKFSVNEFKEYLELWCHEVKTPIATSKLIIENNKSKTTSSILEELEKIEEDVDKVLYYSRSENVEKDYIISKTDLKKVIDNVIKKNKKYLLNKKIKIEMEQQSVEVDSDAKWLEFIINQIILNSIKYSKEKDSFIKINFIKNKNNIILEIYDNGIGIKQEELEKVFDKCFTGSNGRGKYNSTGIGLFLVKKLCDRLGHNITILSKENQYTKVNLVFPNSNLTKVLK